MMDFAHLRLSWKEGKKRRARRGEGGRGRKFRDAPRGLSSWLTVGFATCQISSPDDHNGNDNTHQTTIITSMNRDRCTHLHDSPPRPPGEEAQEGQLLGYETGVSSPKKVSDQMVMKAAQQ